MRDKWVHAVANGVRPPLKGPHEQRRISRADAGTDNARMNHNVPADCDDGQGYVKDKYSRPCRYTCSSPSEQPQPPRRSPHSSPPPLATHLTTNDDACHLQYSGSTHVHLILRRHHHRAKAYRSKLVVAPRGAARYWHAKPGRVAHASSTLQSRAAPSSLVNDIPEGSPARGRRTAISRPSIATHWRYMANALGLVPAATESPYRNEFCHPFIGFQNESVIVSSLLASTKATFGSSGLVVNSASAP